MTRLALAPGTYPDALAARYREAGYWGEQDLAELVLDRAAAIPERPAVSAGRTLTYGELAAQVERLTAALEELGLGPGAIVGVHVPNVLELPAVVLALVRAGAVPVMIVPSLGAREVGHVLGTARASAVVVDGTALRGGTLQTVRAVAPALPHLRHVLVLHPAEDPGRREVDLLRLAASAPPGRREARERPRGRPDDLALFLLSGGTTGPPKLIPRTHRDYVYNVRRSAEVSAVTAATTFLAAIPVAHNFALGCPGVLAVLSQGGRVVLAPRPQPAAMLSLIERERVTMVAAVPSVALDLCDAAAASDARLDSLELIIVGGARLHPDQARLVAGTLGCRLQQSYGMSEGFLCLTRLDDPPEVVMTTQGRPLSPGDELRIVGEDGRDVAPGAIGELLVRGPYTIRGYHDDPSASERAFTSDGFYRTGDLVRMHASGNLVVEGRARDVINRGGEKVPAVEVEQLLAAHPCVRRCAVVGVPDERLGERVCACVVTGEDGAPQLTELRRFLLAQGLARYKLPERLVVMDRLPTTAVGKLDKRALRAHVSQFAD